jgi:hypothetical protein
MVGVQGRGPGYSLIHVTPAPEPRCFEDKVRTPGKLAIAELTGQKPNPPRQGGRAFKPVASKPEEIPWKNFPTYWTNVLPELMESYARVCAYACLRINPITGAASVDHMAPKSRHWAQVYEWDNYRLACSRMNSRKGSFEDVLDPFDAIHDWFQLELVGFQVVPNPTLNTATTHLVEETIVRLGLREQDLCDIREEQANYFWDGEVSMAFLRRESPFLARELVRQNKLRR